MKKGQMIDLSIYRNSNDIAKAQHTISDELKCAIQNLIHQLRELGPLQNQKE